MTREDILKKIELLRTTFVDRRKPESKKEFLGYYAALDDMKKLIIND